MISIMNECEIDRKSAAMADLSFFGMEIPQEKNRVSEEARVSSNLDLAVQSRDLEARVSENGQYLSQFPDYISGSEEIKIDQARVSESDEYSLSLHGFETGDMVWGKVKSHPWWPGHIFNESFASPSVRRTKREGHVLVAFFGDSSYGWFDPAELIPFEPHFIEKSMQTTSRNFVKAVEESVDEASRRAAWGLSCQCRNSYNFRPTNVSGYFAVDVVGFEPGGLYSLKQIKKARDGFVPIETLSFVHQSAMMPGRREPKSVEWIRSMAVVLAYRKAVFEEFDETYAQAFGIQPVRPMQNNLGVMDQPERFAPRVAPLSGPLVIAEALGHKRKSLTKQAGPTAKAAAAAKVPSSKKNKYVLKRRDQFPATNSLPDGYSSQQPHILPSPSFTESSAADYVLQKREPATQQHIKADEDKGTEAHPSGPTPDDWKPKTEPPPPGSENEKPAIDLNDGVGIITAPGTFDGAHSELETVGVSAVPLPVGFEPKAREAKFVDGALKKEKVKKCPQEDFHTSDDREEVKRKKKKKKDGESQINTAGKSTGIELALPEVTRALDPYVPSTPPPKLDTGSLDQLEFPQLVSDLSSLALDPFHGIESNAPSIVRHVFLKFRSLVYQKSLLLLPASELETQELRPSKPADITPLGIESNEQRDPGSKFKPSKLIKRPDDLTKAGRKRALSDRQEDIAAKRLKKLNKLKSLATEKKVGITQKTSEGQKESSITIAPTISAPSTAEPIKKQEKQEPLLPLPPRKESPTFLVMKFPPRSTLPSVSNLKARFARFGPLVVVGTRVFWKSHSCRVQFKYKSDAMNAYNYVRNNNLFGQIQVNYHLRDVEAPALEPPSEPGNRRLESQSDGASQFRPGNGSGNSMVQPRLSLYQQQQQQHQHQHQHPLKSILKKPGDEVVPPAKESQRVKFMLGGDDSKVEPPPVAVGGSFSNVAPPPSSLPPPPSRPVPPQPSLPHSSHAFEPQHLPPPPPFIAPQLQLPPPPPLRIVENWGPSTQYIKAELRRQVLQYGGEVEGRNKSNVDISHQMLSLLLRCNDIVNSLKSLPGYVPYSPL